MKIRPEDIPECYYRVSAKALILDSTRTKFLVVKEEDGRWELPGGGIDHGEVPTETITREIREEMGLMVQSVASQPSYFITFLNVTGFWMGNALYETVVADLDFTPSNECIEVRFVTPKEAKELNAFPNVGQLADIFEPKKHQ